MGSVAIASRDPPNVWGDRKVITGRLKLSSSYATGGDTWTDSLFGLGRVERLIVSRPSDFLNHYVVDYTNKKIVAYVSSTGAQVANGTNLSGNQADFIAIGK